MARRAPASLYARVLRVGAWWRRPARSARPLGVRAASRPLGPPACRPLRELPACRPRSLCSLACLRVGAWGRRPARSPSAPRASLGASSRSPARPCRRRPGTRAKPCGSFGVLHSGNSVFLLVTDGAVHPISRHCTLSDRVQCSLTGAMLLNGCMASRLVPVWGGSCVGENPQLSRVHRPATAS